MIVETQKFTVEQIKERLSQVRTGADFPDLAMNLKSIGITYYETRMEDGRSLYHGANGYELKTGPNYDIITVADKVNIEKLKSDIADHQQGKSDYFEISRQCADNGIEKWEVCLIAMTCTYIDKAGNKILVEHIPDAFNQHPLFTIEQIKKAHSKVKSGADFPRYIQEIKQLGVSAYETYVADGHTDFSSSDNYKVSTPPKYDLLTIVAETDAETFKARLAAHQQGETDYLSFCKEAAICGIEKWAVCMDEMTCNYYDVAGSVVLVERIPQ